jgi:hypothetical protein
MKDERYVSSLHDNFLACICTTRTRAGLYYSRLSHCSRGSMYSNNLTTKGKVYDDPKYSNFFSALMPDRIYTTETLALSLRYSTMLLLSSAVLCCNAIQSHMIRVQLNVSPSRFSLVVVACFFFNRCGAIETRNVRQGWMYWYHTDTGECYCMLSNWPHTP